MRAQLVDQIENAFALTDPRLEDPVWAMDQYTKAHNNPAGINPRYARQTLERGALERWVIPGQTDVILATEIITVGKPYVQLVVGHTGTPRRGGTALAAAWRLYEYHSDWRPRDAFAEVLTRYGVDVIVGDRVGRFIAREFLENADTWRMGFAKTPEDGAEYSSSALIRKTGPGTPDEVNWAYAIDETAYAVDVKRHRG